MVEMTARFCGKGGSGDPSYKGGRCACCGRTEADVCATCTDREVVKCAGFSPCPACGRTVCCECLSWRFGDPNSPKCSDCWGIVRFDKRR